MWWLRTILKLLAFVQFKLGAPSQNVLPVSASMPAFELAHCFTPNHKSLVLQPTRQVLPGLSLQVCAHKLLIYDCSSPMTTHCQLAYKCWLMTATLRYHNLSESGHREPQRHRCLLRKASPADSQDWQRSSTSKMHAGVAGLPWP